MHIEGQALTSKITRVGYYWPTLRKDYLAVVKKSAQKPPRATSFNFIALAFPHVGCRNHKAFLVWQVKFLLVVVDYFTKWVEAKMIAMISIERKKIICLFELPTIIVLDNGTHFASHSVDDFRVQYGIKQSFTSVEHLQANGLVESANKVDGWRSYLKYSSCTTPHLTQQPKKPHSD
ncbi:hypothetical protein CR513_10462, partial [Mucuna pruriens]